MLDGMDNTLSVTPFATRAEFDTAVAEAQRAAAAYYDTDVLEMADADYDALVDRISATKDTHPDWDDEGVVTDVAAGASGGGDVTHPTPMLSLDKVTDTNRDLNAISENADLNRFLDAKGRTGYTVEVKLDGLAVRAVYKDGSLVLAATRGDGRTGEDITAQVTRSPGITGLPARLDRNWSGEIRGEVYMTDTDFETANDNRVAAGGAPFKNPRNATSGALRAVDRGYEAPMSFAAYAISGDDVDGNPDLDNHVARMGFAQAIGFTTAASITPTSYRGADSAADAKAAIVEIKAARASLGFPIDGAVITYNGDSDRAAVGEGSRHPKWALAWKYPAEEGTSSILGIETAIGRTGRITLRARIEPTFVGGTTVTYATLHHPGFVREQNLGIGSRVVVVRAGDVIPRVTAAIGDQPDDVTPWEPPATCPQCGGEWDKSSLLWRCHTPECSVVGRVTYAGQRDVLDIDGLGESMAEALVEAELVSTIADLYDLTEAQVATVKIGTTSTGADRLVGSVTASRLINGIATAKSQPLARHLTSLGIRHLGRTLGRNLATSFQSMSAIREASVEELARVDKVGPEKARKIHEGLLALSNVIDRLVAAGITTEVETVAAPAGKELPFLGMKVVVSGAVPGMARAEAQEAAIRLGAAVSSSVSKNTDLLVHGEGAGSKLAKAESLGVAQMPADEFASLYTSIFG